MWTCAAAAHSPSPQTSEPFVARAPQANGTVRFWLVNPTRAPKIRTEVVGVKNARVRACLCSCSFAFPVATRVSSAVCRQRMLGCVHACAACMPVQLQLRIPRRDSCILRSVPAAGGALFASPHPPTPRCPHRPSALSPCASPGPQNNPRAAAIDAAQMPPVLEAQGGGACIVINVEDVRTPLPPVLPAFACLPPARPPGYRAPTSRVQTARQSVSHAARPTSDLGPLLSHNNNTD